MKLNETNIQPVAVIDIWKFRNENPGASLNLVRDELKEKGGSAKKGERNGKSVMIISGIDEDTLSSLFFEVTGKDIDDYIVVGDWAEEFECGDSIVESMKAVLDKELGKDLSKDVDAIVRRFKSDVKTGDIKAEKTEVTFKKISETIDRRLDENNRKKVLPWVIAKLMLAEGAKEYPKTNVEFGKKYPVIHAFAAHAHKVYKVNQSEVMKAFKALTTEQVNEKKKDCCPKNPNRLVSLKEQLFGSKKTDKKVTESKRMSVNSLIDMISGKTDKNKLKNIAIQKAMLESANPNILGNRAELLKRADLIECAKSGAEEYHKGKKINNKPIKEYSTSQLEKIVSRLNEQIAELNKKVAVMNESEGVKKLKEELDRIVRLQNILSEEIVFRMIKEADENSDIDKEAEDLLASVDFKNTNPNEEDNSSDDNADDSSEEDNDNESNPDEDEVEEISSIKIYVTDKQTAEDLQAELIEDGVPEEAVEIYAKDASDEDEDSSEEDENTENNDADAENSEKTEECAKSDKEDGKKVNEENAEECAKSDNKDGKKVNEDEGDEENADNSENDDNAEGDDADAENSEDEGEWVVALVDTDYVDNLKTVLVDKWGMTEDEFIDQIGGEIVENPDGDSDEDNDEGSSEDDDNADSDNTEGDNEDDDPAGDLDPDQLFKGI